MTRIGRWIWALLLLAAMTSTPALAQVDLVVSTSDSPDPVVVGQQVQYNINVSNAGSATALNVAVSVFYSPQLSSLPPSTPGWICSVSTVISCALASGDLPPGSAPPLPLRFTAPGSPQTVQITVSASTDSTDINPSNNNSIQQSTQVVASNADLTLGIVPSSASATVGNPISFTANVGNSGPAAAPGVQVSGNLSGAIVFSSFSVSSAWNCLHSNGAISCSYLGGSPSGTLPSGVNAAPIVINGVAGPAVGTAQLALNANSQVPDPTPANASSSIVVSAAPPTQVDLSLSKTVIGAQPVPRGQPFTFRLVVSNSGASTQTASSIQVSDPLAAGLTLQSASGSGWNCSATVNCSFSGSLGIGQSAPPIDLVVVFDNPVNGTFAVNNTATVSAAEPDPNPSNNSGSAVANIRSSADIGVAWSGPSTVGAGESFSVSLNASNAGPDAATNVNVDATIPTGFGIGVLSGGAGWTCLLSGQTVSCQRSSLGSGSGNVFGLTLTAPNAPGGPFAFNALASAASFDPSSANNTANLAVGVSAALTGLILLKSDSVDPVARGATFDYVLTVTNSGNVGQTGVRIVDPLPSAMSFQGFTGSGWSCTGPATAGATITCTLIGTLAPSASSAVRIRVSAETAGIHTNTAQVSSSQNSAGAAGTATTTVVEGGALTLSKRARSPSVTLGNNALFDLTVTNPSEVDAANLVLIDDLPAGLDFVAASGEGWTCSVEGARISCRRDALSRGASSSVVVETRPQSAGTYSNRAEASASGVAPVAVTESLTVTGGTPLPTADLSIDLSDSVDPVVSDADFEYQARVRNLGPDVAAGVRVSFVLPATVTSLGSGSQGWACQGSGTVECNLGGSLAAGTESLLRLRARASGGGTVSATASVFGTISDPVQANNSDSESTTIQPAANLADLSISATAPASAAAGTRVDISATIRNLGPGPAAAVRLLAQPNGALVLESGSGSGFTCTASGGALDCHGGSLPPGVAVTLQLQALIATTASNSVSASLTASSTTPDPVAPNNASTVHIGVTPAAQGADLSIAKTDSTDPVSFGAQFSYTLTVRNIGPAAASGVVVRDPLPSGLGFVSAAGSGLACAGGANVVCTAAAPLAAGQQLSVVVTVTAPDTAGSVTNEATVESATSDPVTANNRASQSTAVETPTGTIAEELLESGLGRDPIAGDAVGPVVRLCDASSGRVSALCDALLGDAANHNDAAVAEALRALYPEEVLSHHASLNQLGTAQAFNIDARLAELRGGGGGVSLSGLTIINGRQAIPLGLLQGLFASADEPEIGGTGELISPWGFFVNGSISRGDQEIEGNDREVVQDFDSVAVTAGIDYRRSARWVLGGAIGYNRFESSLTDGGALDTSGFTLTGFSAWYLNDSTYVDTRLSWADIDLEQSRRVRVNLTGFTLDELLDGDTSASQLTFAASVGHHISRGAWTFTPSGFVRYMHSSVDGFSESDSDFAVRYSDQTVKSMVFGAGLQVSRVISLSNGVLTPQFDLAWNQETGNDDTVIDASYVGGEAGDFFRLRPEDPDKSYGSVGFGLVYILANGKQAYLQLRQTVGVEGLSQTTVNVGARFEF
ncbi:MAG: hypothetical protein OMOMHJEC_02660 [Xanthomonadales bacterium]|nr:hypothetical protein [Xanthomonadales bacterium]